MEDKKTNMDAEKENDKENSSLMGQSISIVDKVRNSNLEDNSNMNNDKSVQE